jgi:hypothetical protein
MKDIGKRIKDLIVKMISVKGLCALTFTGLCLAGQVDAWTALVAWGIVIGDRTFEKILVRKGA